ncbi:hypothetical protein JCM3770_004861 [Rhodotorula araucariae]
MPAPTQPAPAAAPAAQAQPAHRTRQATRKMNQYPDLFSTMPSAKAGAFDEAAADLTAFLDFSSYGSTDNIVVPETAASYGNAFGESGAPMGALRPVDDALLDSPLDLELSPASSFASSISGSPFDLAVSAADFTSPLMGSYDSPLLESFAMPASTTGEYPSLFAPVPGADFLAAASSFAVSAPEPQWVPQDIPSLPVLSQLDLDVSTSLPMEDVKPVIAPAPPVLARNESALFDVLSVTPAPLPVPAAPVEVAVVASSPAASASGKRKSVAQLRKEAAQAIPEQSFRKDKFTGVRNTKKPPIEYDAPTLPKNYLTESATSKKRAGPAKVAASIANKRARTASATPGPELPETQPEPIDAEALDEEQLTAIELKRRSNTLAARRSRARKAAHIADLQAEIDRLQSLNETLQSELAAARAGCKCQVQA